MDLFVSISSSPSPQCCFSISVTQQGIQKIIDFLCDLPWRFLTKGTVTAITSWIIFQENEGFILQKKKEAGNGWAQFSLRISPPRWNFSVFSIHPVNKKLKIPFWEAAGGSSITWGGFFFCVNSNQTHLSSSAPAKPNREKSIHISLMNNRKHHQGLQK